MELYFTGKYDYVIDEKFRVALPAAFCDMLGEKAILVPFGDSISIYTVEGHKAWITKLFEDKDLVHDKAARIVKDGLLSKSVTVNIDKSKRISLSKVDPRFRDLRQITKDVVVTGNDDHVEIWNAQTYAQTFEETLDYSSYFFS